jgi:hypothetical protein
MLIILSVANKSVLLSVADLNVVKLTVVAPASTVVNAIKIFPSISYRVVSWGVCVR